VTFLYTDVEGATRLLDQQPEAGSAALDRHEALLRQAIEAHAGHVFSTGGDHLFAAFATAGDGLAAAVDGQRALRREPWGETGPLKVRMGLHTDAAEPRGGVCVGVQLNRTARLTALARGGQILLSLATQDLVRESLPAATRLCDLGEYRLRDLNRPERVFQLVAPDLADDAAPERVLATILFTDIVSSTATDVELGDQRWGALLAGHHAVARDHLPRFHGREIRSTGTECSPHSTRQRGRFSALGRSARACVASGLRSGRACTPASASK
jgi:class 3 adenylate cyclase